MAKAYHGAAGDEGEEGRALSAEEMLVESQLVAMGLLEPRQHMQVRVQWCCASRLRTSLLVV
jgi:hypothetical protein